MTLPAPVGDRPVVGVDGHRGSWIVVRATPDRLTAERHGDLAPLVNAVRGGEVAAAAIDMPMGLLADRPRRSDREARAVLGARRSSVFPTPVRATLLADSYVDACDRSRETYGKALSIQAYNLLPAIRRLDELIQPHDQDRIVEAHPECAFVRVTGEPLPSKRTAEGRAARVEALTAALGAPFVALWEERSNTRDLPAIDLLDAAVLTLTARHVVAGSAIILGGEIDERGLTAQIVY
ncbi:MAG: DUF429 domain-containing protein [Actinomycetota bacterium]